MVSTYMFKRVRNLVKLKKSDRAIALELGIDRKTVAKYRGSNTPPQYKKRVRESRGDPLDDHMETIRAMLKLVDDLPAADIFLTLKDEHGYQGCLRTVQRRVGEIRDEQPKARFFEQEYSLAEHYGKRRNMLSSRHSQPKFQRYTDSDFTYRLWQGKCCAGQRATIRRSNRLADY